MEHVALVTNCSSFPEDKLDPDTLTGLSIQELSPMTEDVSLVPRASLLSVLEDVVSSLKNLSSVLNVQ